MEVMKRVANLKSSKKRIKQNRKRELRNVSVKSAIKTVVTKVEQAIAEGDMEAAQARFSEAVSALDSAVVRGIIKKNSASRKKSKLAREINAAKSAAA
jgi:small subunit ribosomal protein S20